MRRLNVQFSQIEECIRKSLFALPQLPADPPLQKGEELLLQLVMEDARRLGRLDSRSYFVPITTPSAALRVHASTAGRCCLRIPTVSRSG